MDRRINKVAKAAHIKRNTEGTSNEISLSVLDAAKNRLDGGRSVSPTHLAMISLFTLHGKKKSVTTPSKDEGLPLPQQEMSVSASGGKHRGKKRRVSADAPAPNRAEMSKHARRPSTSELVAARKARRRRSRFLAVLSIVVAISLGAGALTWWVYGSYTAEQQVKENLADALDGYSNVDDALSSLDDAMARLDDGEAMLLSADEVSALASSLGKNEKTYDDALDASGDEVFKLLSTAESSEHTLVLGKAQDAVAARKQMLSDGTKVMVELASALDAKNRAASAWQQVLAADSLVREAASLVANATTENVTASSEKSQQAVDALGRARSAFEGAANAYPRADFSAYLSYIDKRVEAQGYAIASNDALLAKDSEGAIAQNDAYTKADAEATELAQALPDDPIASVSSVFESRSAADRESYASARSRASAADAFISDYLGAYAK